MGSNFIHVNFYTDTMTPGTDYYGLSLEGWNIKDLTVNNGEKFPCMIKTGTV